MSRLAPNQMSSFGTSTTLPGSPTLANFKLKEKVCASYTEYLKEISLNKRAVFQDHRSMAVNVQTVTDFHSDMKHTDSYSSVLPL